MRLHGRSLSDVELPFSWGFCTPPRGFRRQSTAGIDGIARAWYLKGRALPLPLPFCWRTWKDLTCGPGHTDPLRVPEFVQAREQKA